MRTLVLCLILWPLVQLHADPPGTTEGRGAICEDLDSATCWPGTRADVTGTNFSETEANDRLTRAELNSRDLVRADVRALLQDPASAYLRDLIRAHLNLSEERCQHEPVLCQTALVEGLFEYMRRGLYPGAPPILLDPHKLENIAAIEENPRYIAFFQATVQKLRPYFLAPETEAKIGNGLFGDVQRLVVKRLQELNISEALKTKLINKINAVTYDKTDCAPTATENGNLIEPNAFYNANRNTVQICAGLLYKTSSDFALVQNIAHEMMHAIDPCHIGDDGGSLFNYVLNDPKKPIDEQYPVTGLVSCLRGEKSIHAVKIPTADETPTFSPQACAVSDQIGESTADWMAAEILPRYMQNRFAPPHNQALTTEQYRVGYANVFAWSCGKRDDSVSVHPAYVDRANRVLLTNPRVRQQLGCPPSHSKYTYCDANGEASSGAPKASEKTPEVSR